MILFTSCTLSYDDGNISMYSRADVLTTANAVNFGYGRSDDVYIALEYIYNNDNIRKEHGECFEITAENIVCHTSTGTSFFFSGAYEGNAEYTIYINNYPYRITLSKPRSGKWTVEELHSES